jgi:uncharacterized membrane protein YgaE (UPF0421/DUF939 family)
LRELAITDWCKMYQIHSITKHQAQKSNKVAQSMINRRRTFQENTQCACWVNSTMDASTLTLDWRSLKSQTLYTLLSSTQLKASPSNIQHGGNMFHHFNMIWTNKTLINEWEKVDEFSTRIAI